ncbi:MAG: septum formation initiator family protein [Dehalococcoidia bacterium]|nr:septum formation initiator family protein [Dehalococcoidia bacterium]
MGALQGTRARLVIVFCLVVAVYGIYSGTAGWYRNAQLESDRETAEQRVKELQDKKQYLEAVKSYVASDAYVEQQARRQLGYGREGETVFVVTSPEIKQDSSQAGSWWERLFPR